MNFRTLKIWNKSNWRNFYSAKWDNLNYLIVHSDGGMNQRNSLTYELQFTNGKILISWNIVIKVLQEQSWGWKHLFDRESVVTEAKIKYLKYFIPDVYHRSILK